MEVTRRDFLKIAGATGVGLAAIGSGSGFGLRLFEPTKATKVQNPNEAYPDRSWEEVYRNIYRFDREFRFNCVPNDTHNCRLTAYVRNGIITRIEQSYDHQKYRDVYGNVASAAHNPRGCLKGYAITRRVYGPYRIKSPMVRKGWMDWVNAGFPDKTPEVLQKYFQRGKDSWVKMSYDEAAELVARAFLHIAKKYSGDEGAQRLRDEGIYTEEQIEAMKGNFQIKTHVSDGKPDNPTVAGTQTFKFRPGMPVLGMSAKMGNYRMSNAMALLDHYVRGVEPDHCRGARIFSNYTWHGDLDPGTPMVTGVQTWDQDMIDHRQCKLYILCGKNFIENKMPEAHWMNEIMERGGKIVVISPEMSPSAAKANYWLTIRPGADVALFLGMSNIIIQEKLYDANFIKRFTDLPLLVRSDNLKKLLASDIIPNYKNKKLENLGPQIIVGELREKWGDFVAWDTLTNKPAVVTRDDIGEWFDKLGIDPALEGTFKVKLVSGKEVEVRPIFQLYKEHAAYYDLDKTADITGSPKHLIQRLARDMGTIKPAQVHTGEGTNHYFHNDQKDRAIWLALTLGGNVGKPGANYGHWSGTYRTSTVGVGFLPWAFEDPFNINLDPNAHGKDIKIHKYANKEEIQYWDYMSVTSGRPEGPLIVNTPKYGRKVFTGLTHMPAPTKVEWYINSNSLNNAKHVYDRIHNLHPHVDLIMYSDWEWTGSCEYADVVWAVSSWVELRHPEWVTSNSNPFLFIWRGGIPPLFNTLQDHEVAAKLCQKLAELTGDQRFVDYWKFLHEGRSEIYIQRVWDTANTLQGYNVTDLLDSDVGWLVMVRTYPRVPGWEMINESKPFYTKSGKLEFYRDEDEFINYGENMIVYREPVQATPYLPNAIVAEHDWIRPDDYGISPDSTDMDEIQVRNIKMTWDKVKQTKNPLWEKGYKFYLLTPKSRYTVHSQWGVTDWLLIWENNFGDPLRMDKRTPGIGEHQCHINPDAAKEMGINDGDYIWVDSDPTDRPYVGWKEGDEMYKVARCMVRATFNPGYPKHVLMMKHSANIATHKSVLAHETRPDGLARSMDTPYQAKFRYGSYQACTRGYLQPTCMTDSLARKDIWGWRIEEGYEYDTHAPNTCPKETLVKVTKAENGGIGGLDVWDPVKTGYTPGYENETMKKYLRGQFVQIQGVGA